MQKLSNYSVCIQSGARVGTEGGCVVQPPGDEISHGPLVEASCSVNTYLQLITSLFSSGFLLVPTLSTPDTLCF